MACRRRVRAVTVVVNPNKIPIVRCDACGRILKRTCTGVNLYMTDDEVCQGTDGPGFYLCGRKDCGARYVALAIDDRRRLFVAQREENERSAKEHRRPVWVAKRAAADYWRLRNSIR